MHASRAGSGDAKPSFGALLRRYRLEKMLSQAQLAELASISVEAVSALERGFRRAPQRQTIALLAKALELEPAGVAAMHEASRNAASSQSTDASPPAARHNLPAAPTRLIGREDDVAAVLAPLTRSRIVTIVGAGGVGKTRVALELAYRSCDGFRDGVWFVEFAPLRDAALVADAIARALRIRIPAGGDAADGLASALGVRELLLVIDNCEHLVERVAELAKTLSARCPNLRIVATSRQPLGVLGEAVYRLPSLRLPEFSPEAALDHREASTYPAIGLFTERAKDADATFALTTANARTVANICRALDGIPLAIELAAARVATLTPAEIYARLEQRFRVLGVSRSATIERHQTLRSMIDWSYELLSERERRFFDRLSEFAGGFTVAGAGAVAADDPGDDFSSLDLVESLVAKSLVVRGTGSGAEETTRYQLLESLRAYGAERLQRAGDRAMVLARFVEYFRSLFEGCGQAFERAPRVASVEALEVEFPNMLAALDAAVEIGAHESGARLLVATPMLAFLGRHGETIARSSAFIEALGDADDALLSRLWFASAIACYWHLASGVDVPCERGLAHARASGDPNVLARALIESAFCLTHRGRPEAAATMLAEAQTVGLGTANLQREFASVRGQIELHLRDYEAALQSFESIAVSAEALGNAAFLFEAHGNAAEAEHSLGRTQLALARLRACEPLIAHALPSHVTRSFANAAAYYAAIDDMQGARSAALEVLSHNDARETVDAAFALEVLALESTLANRFKDAALLEGYVLALIGANEVRGPTQNATYRRVINALRAEFSEAELRALFEAGARLDFERARLLARKPI